MNMRFNISGDRKKGALCRCVVGICRRVAHTHKQATLAMMMLGRVAAGPAYIGVHTNCRTQNNEEQE